MSNTPVKTGQFPFYEFAKQFDIWLCSPLDQGGRLIPGYYPFIASNFRDAMMICKANNLPLPKGSQDRLVQCANYIRLIAQPDGVMPPINDSSETPSVQLLKSLELVLEVKPVDIASHYFDSSAQAVMRDDGQYLFADAGPLILFHWHGGKMGFHLWSGGERFIVDSGECNYDRPDRIKWYCTPPAHNSLLIDGDGDYDREKLKMDGRMPAGCRVVDWQTSPQFDSITMVHNGFQKRSGMQWVRTICLIKGGFTLAVDQVFGPDVHEIILPFHFAPGRVEMDTTASQTFRWHGSACTGELICADASQFDDLKLTTGLVSVGSKDTPSQIATFSAKRSSLRSAFLLGTYLASSPAKLSLQQKVGNDQIEIQARRGSLVAVAQIPVISSAMIEPQKLSLSISVKIDSRV
jgi:hypothetical protein